MIWNTCSVRAASRPATAMTTIAVEPARHPGGGLAQRGGRGRHGSDSGRTAASTCRPRAARRWIARAPLNDDDRGERSVAPAGDAMTTTSYDAIVIGTGQAGPFLAVRLAQAGLKTALIEREHLGGTCVNNGCIPTKTLVASARTAHVARRAGEYGVRVGGAVSVDMKAVKARKDRVVARVDRRPRRSGSPAPPNLTRRSGATRASSARARGRGRRRDARGGADLHQRRRPRRCCRTGTASPTCRC